MISGFFLARHLGPHPYLTAAVLIADLMPDWAFIDFLVDTGAAATCVHPLDAIGRLGISAARLQSTSWRATSIVGSAGVGGSARYLRASARYGFRHDDGKWEIMDGEVLVAELRTDNQTLPSLLGWDLLQHFALSVHGQDRTVTLERL